MQIIVHPKSEALINSRVIEIKSSNPKQKAFAFIHCDFTGTGRYTVGVEHANGFHTSWAIDMRDLPDTNPEGFRLDTPVPKYTYPLIRKALQIKDGI